MEDNREHPNPQGLEELISAGLGQGRLIEAGDLFKMQIEKATGFKVNTDNIANGSALSVWVLTHEKQHVARFCLQLFPGNQDIVVSTGAFVAENRRACGLGWQMLKTRMAVAKKVGFQIMLATVEKNNAKERELLLKNNWGVGTLATSTAYFYYKTL